LQRIQNIIWLLINRWLPKKKLRKCRTKKYEIYSSRLLLGVTTCPVFTRTVLCFWLCYSGHGLELILEYIMLGKVYKYKISDKKKLKCFDFCLRKPFNCISSVWDYTVSSHFECVSMEKSIVNIKIVAHHLVLSLYQTLDYTFKYSWAQCLQFIIIKKKWIYYEIRFCCTENPPQS
jgi:hypothetical protein